MSQSTYKRIDHAVYRTERALVVFSLLVMAVVVFLDVVHRSFSGEESKFAMAIAKVGGWFGAEIVVDTPQYQEIVDASPWILIAVFIGLAYFGIRSTKRDTPVAPPVALVGAVAGVGAAYGLVRLLLVLMPNGLIWSQTLALILTLWVGFIGASMCTYENRHLRVEAVQRFLPEKVRPIVGFISGMMTALVCAALLWLSLRYVGFTYQEYVATDGKGGLFLGMDVPKFVGFSALPIAFGFMTIRFSVKALGALRGEVEAPLDPVAAAGGVSGASSDSLPSEVPTEALASGELDDEKESSIDTMTSRSQMVREEAAPRPQSKVPTDVHPMLPGGPRGTVQAPEAGELTDEFEQTRKVEEGPIQFVEDPTLDIRGRLAREEEEVDR